MGWSRCSQRPGLKNEGSSDAAAKIWISVLHCSRHNDCGESRRRESAELDHDHLNRKSARWQLTFIPPLRRATIHSLRTVFRSVFRV